MEWIIHRITENSKEHVDAQCVMIVTYKQEPPITLLDRIEHSSRKVSARYTKFVKIRNNEQSYTVLFSFQVY